MLIDPSLLIAPNTCCVRFGANGTRGTLPAYPALNVTSPSLTFSFGASVTVPTTNS